MFDNLLEYYSRKDIQKIILNSAKNREIAVKYSAGSFGKRPDILQFENDVFELAKSGATSFHISEEHWSNPLLLKPGMTKPQLDELRTGYDLIIDIDTKFIEYSRVCASLLIDALKFNNIKNIGLKFSGNTGFHLGIPFKSLPSQINNEDIKLLFPDAPRVVAIYLKQMIQEKLSEKVLAISSLQEISKSINKPKEELLINNKFDPYSIIEIDTVLISNRHMYRAPYSLNEKSGLISTPIQLQDLNNFNLKKARIENIKNLIEFLPEVKEQEASQLIIQAFDELKKQKPEEFKIKKSFQIPKNAIPQEFFPPCILSGLKGLQDGRKRFLFVLCNFLKSIGYSEEAIKNLIFQWNLKNSQPLQEGYILSQLNWNKKQKQNILPPNCSNDTYYSDIGIKCTEVCKKYKNPVNYTKKRFFAQIKYKSKKRKTKVKQQKTVY